MKLPMMISAWSCLVLAIFAVSELRPGSSGLNLRGGTGGDCFWNDYPKCPPTPGMCTGCQGPGWPNCNADDAEFLGYKDPYPVCENATAGLSDCGFDTPVICSETQACDTKCTPTAAGWKCTITLDGNGDPVVIGQNVQQSQSASGGSCP